MPINKKDYPPNWASISISIRERANWRCEWCDAPNSKYIVRVAGAPLLAAWKTVTICGISKRVPWGDFTVAPDRAPGSTKIVLTVAHLDRDRTNNDPSNLAALCQRCHLNHDRAAQHIPHRRYGRNHDRSHQFKLL